MATIPRRGQSAREGGGCAPPVAAVSLGEPLEVFRPSPSNVVAGFILSFLMLGGGLAVVGFALHGAYEAGWRLPFDAKIGWSWQGVGIAVLLGILLLAGGAGLGLYARSLLGHRVEICPNGLRYEIGGGAWDVPWSSIRTIKETIHYERLPLVKGPAKLLMPKIASTSYEVVTPE